MKHYTEEAMQQLQDSFQFPTFEEWVKQELDWSHLAYAQIEEMGFNTKYHRWHAGEFLHALIEHLNQGWVPDFNKTKEIGTWAKCFYDYSMKDWYATQHTNPFTIDKLHILKGKEEAELFLNYKTETYSTKMYLNIFYKI